MANSDQPPTDPVSDEVVRDLMIEGIASQMRRGDAPPGPLTWWHLLDEVERDRWRRKAIAHIEQVGLAIID